LKASKKPPRGGLTNILFVWSGVEQVPEELNGMAEHIYVNFPWGSLLQAMVGENTTGFQKLVQLGKPGTVLEVYLTYHEHFEPQTITEKKLPTLKSYLSSGKLVKYWETQGVEDIEWHPVEEAEVKSFPSSWLKKITSQRDRAIFHIKGILR
jgi:16S rRNA (adenine(1408)-N(1))-methyltransferase